MSEEIYEYIWAALPFPAFIITQEGCINHANTAAEHLVAFSHRQMEQKSLSDIFHENSIVISTLRQAQSARGSVIQYNVDVSVQRKPGVLSNIYVSFLEANHDDALLVIQPTGVAQKMSQSLTNLAAARSVSAMAATLAHEIRNPLAGIRGAAQLLAMTAVEEDKALAEMIGQEVKRIGHLVDRVEHFDDQRPIDPKPVNIHDVLDRARRSGEVGYAAHIKFHLDYDPSLPMAAGDADQLLQVFQNLIKNAAEAMEQTKGKITLRTSYNSGIKLAVHGKKNQNLPLQIEVVDNGPGIPDTLIREIFDPFVSSKTQGTGLGLSLVSKIIAAHGGMVDCTSAKGKTVFCVRLPVWHVKKGI